MAPKIVSVNYPVDFLSFWDSYPKKVGKFKAWAAWQRHKPKLAELQAALAWQATSLDWTKEGGAYIPHPATYLNQGRQFDEPMVPVKKRHLTSVPEALPSWMGELQKWSKGGA